MTRNFSVLFSDGVQKRKRPVRMEVMGTMFVLYEQEWRSEGYRFDQLHAAGEQGGARIYSLDSEDSVASGRKIWFSGDLPQSIAAQLPQKQIPALSNGGLLAIAYLCLAIGYNSTFIS